jgi:sulfur carrier protein
VVKVLLNHPVRELDIPGPKRVKDLLKELALLPESVLVVRGDDLVTEDDTLRDNDRVEIRPVMSGGQGKKALSRLSEGKRVGLGGLDR